MCCRWRTEQSEQPKLLYCTQRALWRRLPLSVHIDKGEKNGPSPALTWSSLVRVQPWPGAHWEGFSTAILTLSIHDMEGTMYQSTRIIQYCKSNQANWFNVGGTPHHCYSLVSPCIRALLYEENKGKLLCLPNPSMVHVLLWDIKQWEWTTIRFVIQSGKLIWTLDLHNMSKSFQKPWTPK